MRRRVRLIVAAAALGLPAAALGESTAAAESATPVDPRLLVDQFGYRPGLPKVAVVRSPRIGHDAAPPYRAAARYELRDAETGATVLAGTARPWLDSAVQPSSGDAGWWFDFSAHDAPGRYYVFDPERKQRSPAFRIADDVYAAPLKAALRTFYYQRSGIAKRPPHADPCWADEAAYLGPGQDTEARDIARPGDASRARDLSGGWFDAGDTNKYVTFAARAVHRLLAAYQDHPGVFDDALGIPESGNGIPDLLDEVDWEMRWLEKMQNSDGSLALKVGAREYPRAFGPPSEDRLARYYVARCTSSTIAGAAAFAHAALVYRDIEPLKARSEALQHRARKAFDAFMGALAPETDCDRSQVLSGDADLSEEDQIATAAVAAAWLFALTGEPRYEQVLRQNYRATWAYRDVGWSRYEPQQGEALLHYARRPGADAALGKTLLDDKLRDARAGHGIYGRDTADLYRNTLHPEQYHWGSHAIRASYGTSNFDMVRLGLDATRRDSYRDRGFDTVHYFHGVNPFGIVYLSNMEAYGATRSLRAIYHVAYAPGAGLGRADARAQRCGPVPGFITGGPNRNAVADGVPATLVPPAGQPDQKSYRDWNAVTDAAWTLSEPSITYQAAYVKLLAAAVATPP